MLSLTALPRPAWCLTRTEYVDNFFAFGKYREVVRSVAEEVQQELHGADLPTRPVEAGPGVTALGWTLSDENAPVGLSPRVACKIRLAIQQILRGVCVNGDALTIVMSHCATRALSRRELLRAFSARYSLKLSLGPNAADCRPLVVANSVGPLGLYSWLLGISGRLGPRMSSPLTRHLGEVASSSRGPQSTP